VSGLCARGSRACTTTHSGTETNRFKPDDAQHKPAATTLPEAKRDKSTSMKIRDVMTPEIDVVSPEDTLTTGAQLMADLDFETLLVSDKNRLTA
jgi:predicted transcriptional regulator